MVRIKVKAIKKVSGGARVTGMKFNVKRPKKPSLLNPLNWFKRIRDKKIRPTGKDK